MKIELKTNRLENLSDGIFAFAMTLLVFGFDSFFNTPQQMTETALFNMILGLWPDLLHYIEGFVIIGVLWLEHHHQFHYIQRTNPILLLINALALMLIALIPVTTALVGDYGHMFITAFVFELNVLLIGVLFYINWRYATSNYRLVDSDLSSSIIKSYRQRNLIIPFISVISLFVSSFNPRLGIMLYFIVPVLLMHHSLK